jgi:O-methyltransferase involved in polyketide biosynthesis
VSAVTVDLGTVQETLLIPLYGRADLTRRGSPLIDDAKAVEMVDAIVYDFAKFDGTPSLFGSVLRTRIYDYWISRWLRDHPAGTVVEIGAGLNTRFERLDNGRVHWIDLDLPDAMELRRRFFAETDRRRLFAGSVLDEEWLEAVASSPGPWFFAAEAVLIYLPEADVRRTLRRVARRFPGSPIAFDTWGSWMLEHQDEHDTLASMEARVEWACDDPAEFEVGGDLRLFESCTFPESPAEILDLVANEVRELLVAFADDPRIHTYRQNLFESISP